MEEITPRGIIKFMREVHERRDHHFILFLGAKAGIFFENQALYAVVKNFSAATFDTLDREQKFRSCYRILEENFSERDRDSVLSWSWHDNKDYHPEYEYLGELIRSGFFDAVISTNIDPLLEDALQHENVSGEYNYRVHIYGKTAANDILNAERGFVLKIFGDLESKLYKTAGDEFHIDEDPVLRDFLETILANPVLMVGYNPEWDKPLDKAFFMKGGELIYVNDVKPDSVITRALEKRSGKCLIDKRGAFKDFMRDLYAQFFEREPFSYEAIREVTIQLQRMQEKNISQFQSIQKEIDALHEEDASQFKHVQEEISALRKENTAQFQHIQEKIDALREALQRIEKNSERRGDMD